MLGLKRGVVELAENDPEWEIIAARTIERLWSVFGSAAKDIQHVGSTAIKNIKAKPIIDIAVAVDDFDEVEQLIPTLESEGFTWRKWENDERMLFAIGDYVNPDGGVTHFIHVVTTNSEEWFKCVGFRDYLNANLFAAKEYEALKVKLANENPIDPGREKYVAGKSECIAKILADAHVWMLLREIPDYNDFVKIEPINKGWSDDKKYYIETIDDRRMFLRISDISEFDRKKAEYGMMERVYEIGVITPKPYGFGLCDDGKSVYSLSGWLDGNNAEESLPFISEAEQYNLGLKAGETLRKIHTLSVPDDIEPWCERFYRKMQGRIDFYNANPIKSKNGDKIISFLQENKNLLDNRPQTFNHGDYNKSNIIVMPDGQIGVIDFNAYNKGYGDPWWEFDPTNWGNEPNAYFFTGLLNGYFGGSPPSDFFQMHRYYLAYDALAALCDTSVYNQGEPEEGRRHLENILRWFDNMQNPVPTWYLKEWSRVI